MTVISAPTDSRLRLALRLDAILSGLVGVALAAFADPLSSLSGFTPTQEYVVGAGMVFYGVVVFSLARMHSVRRAGIGVVIANLVGTALAAGVAVSGVLPLTTLGLAGLWFSAVYTTAFAALQWAGVRRMS